MTILVNEAYERASRRSAEWAGEQVRRRFAQVYGDQADQVLAEIREQMESNIRSDGRVEEVHSDPRLLAQAS